MKALDRSSLGPYRIRFIPSPPSTYINKLHHLVASSFSSLRLRQAAAEMHRCALPFLTPPPPPSTALQKITKASGWPPNLPSRWLSPPPCGSLTPAYSFPTESVSRRSVKPLTKPHPSPNLRRLTSRIVELSRRRQLRQVLSFSLVISPSDFRSVSGFRWVLFFGLMREIPVGPLFLVRSLLASCGVFQFLLCSSQLMLLVADLRRSRARQKAVRSAEHNRDERGDGGLCSLRGRGFGSPGI